MAFSRRNLMAAGAAALGTKAAAAAALKKNVAYNRFVDDLVRRSGEGNAALMRGDAKTYAKFVSLGDDFTLMSPFGGKPSHGTYTPERWEEIARFFRNGTFSQEVVQTYGSADMVTLVLIERANVEVGGVPAQDWALRVTLVYRREGTEWLLVHRHADPMSHGITLQQAAALGRGEAAPVEN